MTATKAYAAQSASSGLSPFTLDRRDLRPDDVAIEIDYCGVCHTDIHFAENDWGFSVYPVVPGHEIIGRVTAVGDKVSQYKAGDRVGVGCMVDSCRHCSACESGLEQYCFEGMTGTYNGEDRHDGSITYGGYSDKVVVSERFVLRIPDKLDPAAAAPLLCAGITTYSPLRHYGVRRQSRRTGDGRPGPYGREVRQGSGRRSDHFHPLRGQGRRSQAAGRRSRDHFLG